MLIIGWTTNDYRGPKAWAAYWSTDDTSKLRDDAARYIKTYKLENAVLRWRDDTTPIEEAKRQVAASLGGQ